MPHRPIVVGQLLGKASLGGAEVLVAHLANCHARSGQASRLVVLGDEGPLVGRLDSEVAIHYCNYFRASIRNPLRFAASVIQGFRLLKRTIREQSIDVLHVHLPDTILWGFILQLAGCCRTVVTIHSNEFFPPGGGTLLRRWVNGIVYGSMVEKCRPVVMVSDKVRTSFAEKLALAPEAAAKLRVIDNGIPIPDRCDEGRRAELRRSLGIDEGDCLVVAVGRLAVEKNFQCLIRAAGLLRQSGAAIRVLICGEGLLRRELEDLVEEVGVKDILSMPGNLDNVQEVLAAADIFAMPSRWEGLSLALLEAMASGLPVVGSRTRGIADILRPGEHGLLTEVDDHSGMAEALLSLATDGEMRRRMGQAGRKFVEARYSINRVYEEYLEVYRERMD